MTNGTRRGWRVSITPRPLFTSRKDPVPIVQEAGWAPGPAWAGVKNLAPTGIRSPDRPARSQSLDRLSYPGPHHSQYRTALQVSNMYSHQNICFIFLYQCLLSEDEKSQVKNQKSFNPLNAELNPICYLLALLAHHFLHVIRIRVKSLILRLLMSYIYIHGAPILDVSRSHTTTQHSR